MNGCGWWAIAMIVLMLVPPILAMMGVGDDT
jgi:hypothetical protein